MTSHLQVTLPFPWDQAIERLTAALKDEGFGIVSSLAMDEIFRNRLGLAFHPYWILGACNPTFAHRVLEADPRAGLLLPCNVTVEAVAEGVRIVIDDPEQSFAVSGLKENPVIWEVAAEARTRLGRVAQALRKAGQAKEVPA